MIGSEILTKAYLLTDKSESTFLDGSTTTFYSMLNTAYGHRILDILRARVDRNATINEVTTTFKSTIGLVEGDNGFNGEYAFPSDLLMPKRVEVSFDGSTWIKCQVYDNALNTRSEYNSDQINAEYSDSSPMVDFLRNSFKIRPLKTTSGDIEKGIYIEYEKRQDDFSSTTSPSEIESNLQDILAYDLAELDMIMHADKYSGNHISVFKQKKQEVEDRFFNFYNTRLGETKRLRYKVSNYR